MRSIEAAPGSGSGSGGGRGERGRAAAGEGGGGGAGPSLHVACTAHSEHRARSRAHTAAQSTHSTYRAAAAAGWSCRGKEGAAAGVAAAPAPPRFSGAPGLSPPKRGVYKGKAQGTSRVWAPILHSLSSTDSCFPEAATGISAVTLSRLQEEKASLLLSTSISPSLASTQGCFHLLCMIQPLNNT